MKVHVKKDESSSTLVDLGDDAAVADKKLRELVDEHGLAAVTNEDGTPVVLKLLPEKAKAKPKAKPKAKAKSKAKAKKKGAR